MHQLEIQTLIKNLYLKKGDNWLLHHYYITGAELTLISTAEMNHLTNLHGVNPGAQMVVIETGTMGLE